MLAYRVVRRLAQQTPSDRGGDARRHGERRVAPLLALLGVVGPLVGVALSTPRPGLRGVGLGISLASAAMLAGGLQLVLRRPDREREGLAAMLLLGLAAAALAGLDPNSAAYIGTFIAAGALALRVERRLAFAGTALIAAAMTLAFALSRTAPSVASIASVDLGIAFVFAMATFAREQQRLIVELREAQAALAEAAALQERTRLAREIHDVLAHSLTGLSLQLEGARLLLQRDGGDAEAVSRVERAQALARSGLEETRRAVGALRGDSMPGPELLGELAASFARDTGIDCDYAVSGTPLPLASEARLALYRTAQEALSNVRKHAASASHVSVSLAWSADAAELTVADHDGGDVREPGLDLSATGGGYGLSGVRERAELLGGTLSAGASGDGFRVHLRLPA